MKRLITFCLAALLIGGLGGCKEDDTKNVLGVDIEEPYNIGFEITDKAITSTTYSFAVSPSDKQAPYVCLYVDKSVIDRVQKQELPAFLLKELQKNAESQNKPWDVYLASITQRGDAEKTLENLLPGNMYELVVFGIKGQQLSRQAGYRFFETLKADQVAMTFETSVAFDENKPTVGKVTVKPSIENYKWFLCSFPKKTYEKGKAQGMSDLQLVYSFLQQDLQHNLPPEPTEADIEKFIQARFFENEQTLSVGGRSTKADTEYTYLVTAVYITANKEIVFTSATHVGHYTTPKVKQKETTFTLKVENIRQTAAAISVSPSDPAQVYVWRCGAYNEALSKMTPEEHAKYIIETNPYIMWEARAQRDITYPDYKLMPGTKHFLIAFGYEGGVCTKVFREDFDPQPAGDPTLVNFQVTKVSKTTDRIKLKVEPSDASVFYIPLLFPDSENKERIKGRIIAGLRRALYQNLQGGFNPHMTLWDVIEQQSYLGESEPEWTGLNPGAKYTLMVLTFKKDGIAAERKHEPSFLTVPGFSTVTVGEPQILGVFDGDEEKGDIFGKAYLTKGKAIMVIKYKSSTGVSQAFASATEDMDNLDELDTKALPDAQIISNRNLQWTSLKLNKPYMYLLMPWDKPQISFSYGLSTQNERGPIARVKLKAAVKGDKSAITKLKDLYDLADDPGSYRAPLGFHPSREPLWLLPDAESVEHFMPVRQATEVEAPKAKPQTLRGAQEQGSKAETPEHLPLVHVVK